MKGDVKKKLVAELTAILEQASAFQKNPVMATVWADRLYDAVLDKYFSPHETTMGVATITEAGEVLTWQDSPLKELFAAMPEPAHGALKTIEMIPVETPWIEPDTLEDIQNRTAINHFGDGMNEHLTPHTLEEADRLTSWADGYIFRQGWDNAKAIVAAQHKAEEYRKAFEYARMEINTEFHDAKERTFESAPEMQSFANGVEHGLSKALMIMNRMRVDG